jgi:hypothetical protein
MADDKEVLSELNAVAAEHPEIGGDDDLELSEELAATVIIEKLLDTFIEEITEILSTANEVSLDGNPVRTHLELVNASQDIVELAYELRGDLVRGVANRAEEIPEQGGNLRKQVVDEQLVTPLSQARRPLSSIPKTEEN